MTVTAHPHSLGTCETDPTLFFLADTTFVLLVLEFAAKNPPVVTISQRLKQSSYKVMLPHKNFWTVLHFRNNPLVQYHQTTQPSSKSQEFGALCVLLSSKTKEPKHEKSIDLTDHQEKRKHSTRSMIHVL
jgi:hypothetical protein